MPSSLPSPSDITRVELPNGIVVLARANFTSPSIVISGYLPAGALFDSDEQLGLADFTASTLMDGTAHRSQMDIYGALEAAGASLGFDASTHSAGFSGRALAEDLDLLLDLAADALRHPVFPPEQIERQRAEILTSLALRAENTGAVASLTFDEIVYPNHPYRRPEEGWPETVRALTREDLLAFHARHYGPRGLVLAIVGGLEPARAIEKAARALGDWENPAQPALPALPPLTPLPETSTRRATIPGKFQADLIIGVSGPPRAHPGFLAASLGNNILGQFGIGGRIGDIVREQAGLAYSAHSSLSGGLGPGPWYVSAGVDPENVAEAAALIRQELARFVEADVTEEELADSKANYWGRLPISLESNSGVASVLLNLERYQLGLDYYTTYRERLEAVTPADILAIARQYLDPARLAIAIAGPA